MYPTPIMSTGVIWFDIDQGLVAVTQEEIITAVVIYLLSALMWSYTHALLALYQPGSLGALEGLARYSRQFFLHYSLVAHTTLGVIDIPPLTEKAKALMIRQAFIGQIDLVVALAWPVAGTSPVNRAKSVNHEIESKLTATRIIVPLGRFRNLIRLTQCIGIIRSGSHPARLHLTDHQAPTGATTAPRGACMAFLKWLSFSLIQNRTYPSNSMF